MYVLMSHTVITEQAGLAGENGAFTRLRPFLGSASPVIVLSELKTKLPFLLNLEPGKTWI